MTRALQVSHSEQPSVPSAGQVHEALGFILGRAGFDASERNRRFLSYVVEETLAGRGDRIKAYNIAIAAFDRAEDFDPLTDPIVRIEASRLRRSLQHYYLTAGRSDPLQIDIPKGSYVARFNYAEVPPEAPSLQPAHEGSAKPGADENAIGALAPRRKWISRGSWMVGGVALAAGAAVLILGGNWNAVGGVGKRLPGRTVMIRPFEDVSVNSSKAFIARGLSYEIIGALARYKDLRVVAPDSAFPLQPQEAWHDEQSTVAPDYILTGAVHPTETSVRVSTLLSDARTGQYVWSTELEHDLNTGSLPEIESEIADRVAGVIAAPDGVISKRAGAAPPQGATP